MTSWTAADIPDQTGRTAVVTGANAGLGFQVARELARHGARTVLGCRDAGRGGKARERILAEIPEAQVELAELDLADLASVRRFADTCADRPLDVLVNNAGVVQLRRRETTADGFERQFGTNHLGHFALTGLLLPTLLARPGARVVTMSSMEVRWARLDLDDLQSERRYGPDRAYAQSKLANLVFALELDRRLRSAGADVRSLACHPGWSATDQPQPAVFATATRLFAQPASRGALPALYAATAPDAAGGTYLAPDGFLAMRGHPRPIRPVAKALDPERARRLWALSEELTGVRYDALTVTPDATER